MIQSSAPFTPSMQKLLPLVSGRQQTAVLTFHTNELFWFNDPFCYENKKVTQIVAKTGKVGMYGKRASQTPSQLKMDPNATYRPPETSVFVFVYMWYGNIGYVNKWVKERETKKNRKREREISRIYPFLSSRITEKRGLGSRASNLVRYVLFSSPRRRWWVTLKGGRLKQLLWVEAVC